MNFMNFQILKNFKQHIRLQLSLSEQQDNQKLQGKVFKKLLRTIKKFSDIYSEIVFDILFFIQIIKKFQKKMRSYKFFRILTNILIICIAQFYFGFSLAYFSSIPTWQIMKKFQSKMEISVFQGMFSGLIPIGACIGAVLSSFLIKAFSRRDSLLFTCIITILATLLIQVTHFIPLLIGRLIQGICTGLFSAICPLMIKQLSPIQIAGCLGSLNQTFIVLGIICANVLSIFVEQFPIDGVITPMWRYIFGIPIILCLFQIVCLILVYPTETPKYFLLNKKWLQAKQLISQLYQQQYVQQVLETLQKDVKQSQESLTYQVKHNPYATFFAVFISVQSQFVGINVVILYGNQIIDLIIPNQGGLISTCLNITQLIGCLISTFWLLDKFGKKVIVQIGIILLMLTLIAIATAFLPTLKINTFFSDSQKLCITISLFIYMAVFGLSIGVVTWQYVPEIVQPNIVSYTTLANWLGASVTIILFPIIGSRIGQSSLYYFFSFWSLMSLFVNHKYMVQTKDKTQIQINNEYEQMRK